jgi:glycosyltransferase involved in cell wall biosynthesis
MPRVSVIIPTYNRAADVARCLDSLVAQTFRDFEVLVCDDGSTDETADVVRRYSGRLELSYHWAENFGGPARPRNMGLRLARAAYVALLDSDDWWAPRKLEESVRFLDGGADLVYHDLYSVNSTRRRLYRRKRRTRVLRTPVYRDLLSNGNAICNSSVVVRRDLLLSIGGFCEETALIAWEDYDAWLRLARITERFERIVEPLGYYWNGGGNISSPRRLIDNLKRFIELYVVDGTGASTANAPAWCNYLLGLAHYRLGEHSAALSCVRCALDAGLPPMQSARALLTAAAASVHVLTGGGGLVR